MIVDPGANLLEHRSALGLTQLEVLAGADDPTLLSFILDEVQLEDQVDHFLCDRRGLLGLEKLPVCIAKTQKSLSDNPALLGRPKDFIVTVREIEIASGAGFVVPITGNIMRMPGLPAHPASENISIDAEGNIVGLF